LLERRRCGRRTTLTLPQDLCLDCVPRYDRWPRSSLRCRRRRSNRISYREARPSARTRRRRTRPWPGCPAPCSTKGVEAAWRSGRLLTRANLDLLRGPIPFSSVWKSNFGLWPNSLVDLHTGARAVRKIRPGHVSFLNFDEYHLNQTTGAAVASKPGPERGPSSAEATVRETSRARPPEAGPPLRRLCDG
jgi:hypothetical protein